MGSVSLVHHEKSPYVRFVEISLHTGTMLVLNISLHLGTVSFSQRLLQPLLHYAKKQTVDLMLIYFLKTDE